MTEKVKSQCREALDRLYGQIEVALHEVRNSYGERCLPFPMPIERLPAAAELVRVYVETEAVFADAVARADAASAEGE